MQLVHGTSHIESNLSSTVDSIIKKLQSLFDQKVAQDQVMGKTKEIYPKIELPDNFIK